jgi:hypothetical protein
VEHQQIFANAKSGKTQLGKTKLGRTKSGKTKSGKTKSVCLFPKKLQKIQIQRTLYTWNYGVNGLALPDLEEFLGVNRAKLYASNRGFT